MLSYCLYRLAITLTKWFLFHALPRPLADAMQAPAPLLNLGHKHRCLGTLKANPPFSVMMMAPARPAYVSSVSSQWEWYIHIMDEGSAGPGPARSGTCTTKQTYELTINISGHDVSWAV